MGWLDDPSGPWSQLQFASDQSLAHCPVVKSDTLENFHLDSEDKSAAKKEKRAVRRIFNIFPFHYTYRYRIHYRYAEYLHKFKRNLFKQAHIFS